MIFIDHLNFDKLVVVGQPLNVSQLHMPADTSNYINPVNHVD